MTAQETEILTCKNRVPAGSKGLGERLTRECGARCGSASFAVVATGRVLRDVREIGEECVGAWCHSCKRATEYRRLVSLAEVA